MFSKNIAYGVSQLWGDAQDVPVPRSIVSGGGEGEERGRRGGGEGEERGRRGGGEEMRETRKKKRTYSVILPVAGLLLNNATAYLSESK